MVYHLVISVKIAIPIIMGSNIGTSVTGMIVASGQATARDQFKQAISAATCNDMFNWLSVLVLLPIEAGTGYLYHLTNAIVKSTNLAGGGESQDFLKAITKPFTNLIVQVSKMVFC